MKFSSCVKFKLACLSFLQRPFPLHRRPILCDKHIHRWVSDMAAKISVIPRSSLMDRTVRICISGLKAHQRVTLHAAVVGDGDEVFESHAYYIANKEGDIDVSHDTASGGSYSGIEPMGFLWSMTQALDFIKFEPDHVKLSGNGTLILKETYPPDATDVPGCNAAIQVENIQGDILLICGADDQSLKAERMAEKIASRLRKFGKENQCTVRCYPGTGHLIEPPYAPPCLRSYHKSYGMSVEWGGQPQQHAFAQEDSWKQILKFFSKKLSFVDFKSRL